MEDYEKNQVAIKLITELAKGKKAGEEQGWLSVEDIKQDLVSPMPEPYISPEAEKTLGNIQTYIGILFSNNIN
jgi:hypothetical protein